MTIKDIITSYLPKVVLLAIGAVVTLVLRELFEKRSKVVYYLTQVASFDFRAQTGTYNFHTRNLIIQNSGRAEAEEIQVVHNWLPQYFSVFPPMDYQRKILPEGREGILLPGIPARETVTISYLYLTPPSGAEMLSHIWVRGHTAQLIDMALSRRHPRWINVAKQILLFLGAILGCYLAYESAISLGRFFLK